MEETICSNRQTPRRWDTWMTAVLHSGIFVVSYVLTMAWTKIKSEVSDFHSRTDLLIRSVPLTAHLCVAAYFRYKTCQIKVCQCRHNVTQTSCSQWLWFLSQSTPMACLPFTVLIFQLVFFAQVSERHYEVNHCHTEENGGLQTSWLVLRMFLS